MAELCPDQQGGGMVTELFVGRSRSMTRRG